MSSKVWSSPSFVKAILFFSTFITSVVSAREGMWLPTQLKQQEADMLVIGSHGHSGLKDFIYGETVNAVRHELKVPVLVVSL